MKIMEIIPTIGLGGAERFVVDLCNNMVTNGHDITLVVLYKVDRSLYDELDNRISIIILEKKLGLDIKTLYKVNSLIMKLKPDVVHSHLYVLPYLLPSVFKNKSTFIHTVHSDAKVEAEGKVKALIRKFLFKNKLVYPVTISDESKRSFSSFYKLGSKLIYNGRPDTTIPDVDIKKAQDEMKSYLTNSDACVVVNVARISAAKNQVMLAKAITNLNKKGYKIEVFIIGNVKDQILKESIESINSPYVHLIGPRPSPRVYMKAAGVFTLSSVNEGMPITLIECFSVGAIPICTPVGGIVDMISDGTNGILSKSCKQEDFEIALERYMCLSNEDRENMKYESRESYSLYGMDSCTNNYLTYINELRDGNNN